MAFKGDLTNISLFDVFQTLNTNQQTGVLVLQREGVTKKVFISPQGVRIYFTRSFRALRLGEIFVRRGLITPQDVEILLLQQKQEYRPIGELLVESGKVPQEEVDKILRYHAEDEIFEIFAWESGSFAFYDGETEAEQTTTPLSDVLMDPAGLCLEAARRLDELERLRSLIESNSEFFVQVKELQPDREKNPAVVCAVYDSLSAPQSVDDLRDMVGLSLFDVLRTLAQLVEGGLIRPLDREELVDAGRVAREAGEHERAAQLFEKAFRLDPLNRELVEECVTAIQALNQPQRLSRYLATLGALCFDTDDIEAAIEHLEQALRHDSDNFDALFRLRDAFARHGDAERAAETSLKVARAYAEEGNLPDAVEACRVGLDASPGGIALRFYLAQLLARADEPQQAQQELYHLVRETEANRKAMRSRKAHELLASCYRLLLKIDAGDEEAHRGMRSLDRQRMSSLRKRKLVVRGGIAAAVLVIVAGIGLALGGPGPEELYERILVARRNNNLPVLLDAISELESEHPESGLTHKARALRRQVEEGRARIEKARKDREDHLQADFAMQLEEVRALLDGGDPIAALGQVKVFLDRLRRPEATFLRKSMQPLIEFALITFLEKMGRQFDTHRQEIAISEQQLKARKEKTAETLHDQELRLDRVRAQDWPTLSSDMAQSLAEIRKSPFVGGGARAIDAFGKRIASAKASFSSLDRLFYTVRRERLRVEIQDAVDVARKRGREYLGKCQFQKARELYDRAYGLADGVTDEQPREHFRELLQWLTQRSILLEMERRRSEIDEVTSTLDEIDRLRVKRPAAAYKLLRDLVTRYRVIQFERKYKMPYLVTSTPEGAEVIVDGRGVGTTPVAITMDIVGRPVVRVKLDGFGEEATRIDPLDQRLSGTLEVTLRKRVAWVREIAGLVEASPVIAGNLLLVSTSNADLLGIRLADGLVEWEAKSNLLDRIQAAPVVCGDHAYFVTVGGWLHEVRLGDGKITGRKPLHGRVRYDGVWDGKRLYFATRDRRLIALSGTEIVYDRELAHAPATGLVEHKGRLYVGTAEGEILVHKAASGEAVRRFKTSAGSSFFGGVAVHGDLVVGGAEDGALYAFSRKSGKQVWRYPTPGPITASPMSDGKLIYLPASDGEVYALNAKGHRQVRYDLGSVLEGPPVKVGRFLYAIGGNRVTAFDTGDEKPWWEHVFDADSPTHIVAGAETIVVVTTNAKLIAFPKDER